MLSLIIKAICSIALIFTVAFTASAMKKKDPDTQPTQTEEVVSVEPSVSEVVTPDNAQDVSETAVVSPIVDDSDVMSLTPQIPEMFGVDAVQAVDTGLRAGEKRLTVDVLKISDTYATVRPIVANKTFAMMNGFYLDNAGADGISKELVQDYKKTKRFLARRDDSGQRTQQFMKVGDTNVFTVLRKNKLCVYFSVTHAGVTSDLRAGMFTGTSEITSIREDDVIYLMAHATTLHRILTSTHPELFEV